MLDFPLYTTTPSFIISKTYTDTITNMEAFEFSDDVQKQIEQFEKKLEGVQAEISEFGCSARAWMHPADRPELAYLYRHSVKYSIKKQEPVFAERDEVLSKVDGFWRKAVSCKQHGGMLEGGC